VLLNAVRLLASGYSPPVAEKAGSQNVVAGRALTRKEPVPIVSAGRIERASVTSTV